MFEKSDVLIIGGGFFGCSLAVYFSKQGRRVIVLEKEAAIMERASFRNQARIHNGYHYPRSLLTAMRSRRNFPVFVEKYNDCVVDDFVKLYAIPKNLSKVSASQFKRFCSRIGADIDRAGAKERGLFASDLIDDVFSVTEYAFDSTVLRRMLLTEMSELPIRVEYETAAVKVESSGGELIVSGCLKGEEQSFISKQVFNCTYSQLNLIPKNSGFELLPLKHELTEMGLLSMPPEMSRVGVTLMCGPFFSCMPFPARALHSISHVRYTPHGEWTDGEAGEIRNPTDGVREHQLVPRSQVPMMIADASRYIPRLAEACHVDSLWEVKTVLKSSEVDDSRPILFHSHHGVRNYHSILGGKIDNVFDFLEQIDKQGL